VNVNSAVCVQTQRLPQAGKLVRYCVTYRGTMSLCSDLDHPLLTSPHIAQFEVSICLQH
jgi:hypothetical protein